ncbi:diguanylate cyclase domain protein, partial [Vibrio parahaemolyticus AQ3810]
HHLWLKVKAW